MKYRYLITEIRRHPFLNPALRYPNREVFDSDRKLSLRELRRKLNVDYPHAPCVSFVWKLETA